MKKNPTIISSHQSASMGRLRLLTFLAVVCGFLVSSGLFAGPPAFSGRIAPADLADDDELGKAIAISGDRAVVATQDGGNVYVIDLTDGSVILTITKPFISFEFGYAVAIDKNLMAISDPANSGGTISLFDLSQPDPGSGTLTISALDPGRRFGHSLAIEGSILVVGDPLDDELEPGVPHGSIRVFDLSLFSDPLNFELSSLFGQTGSRMGESVDIEGGKIVAGSPNNNLVSVRDLSTEVINSVSGAAGEDFGRSVAISGDRILVGARAKDSNTGAACVYDSSTLALLETLEPGQAGGLFGHAVALSGERAVVGAPFTDQVYLFNAASGKLIDILEGDEPDAFIGFSVDASPKHVIVGAPFEDRIGSDLGAAYVFHSQPDNRIGSRAFTGPGNNIYNGGGGQRIVKTSAAARPVKGFWSIENDGNSKDSYEMRGGAGSRIFRVKYFSRTGGRANVTAAMLAGIHDSGVVAGGAKKSYECRVTPVKSKLRFTSPNGAVAYKRFGRLFRFKAQSSVFPTRKDQARMRVNVR